MTATIRVGHCLGARQVEKAKVVARTALTLSVAFAVCIACCTVAFRQGIAGIYTKDAAVAALATHLLLFQAAYQLVDGLQATGIGILRGHNDTRIISFICFGAYWIVGLPLGVILARTDLFVPAMPPRFQPQGSGAKAARGGGVTFCGGKSGPKTAAFRYSGFLLSY